MKSGFFSYMTTQFKRYLKGLPLILSVTVMLLGVIGLIAFSFFKSRENSEDKSLAKIGLVGDMEGSYLGIGIEAVTTLDPSQLTINFVEMDYEEARAALSSGDITIYVVIPEGFIDDIVSGKNPKLDMVGRGTRGIGGILISELSKIISTYLDSSETSIYAMQDLAWAKGDTEAYLSTADDYFMVVINGLFGRDDAVAPIFIGFGKGSSLVGYYTCGIMLLFILLMGISFCAIFVKQKKDVQQVLYSKGIGPARQVLSEYFCYLVSLLLIITTIVMVVSIVAGKADFKSLLWQELPIEADWYSSGQIIRRIYASWIPAICMIAALQLMIFELADGIVSSVLAQFLTAIALGYICGLFYPINYFPVAIQKVSAFLPVKAAMDYCQSRLAWNTDILHLMMLYGYIALFIGASMLVRWRKLLKK